MAFVLVCMIVNFALAAESNDSRLVGVSKKEFIRVIGDIIKGSSESNGEDENVQEIVTPRSAALRRARLNASSDAYGKRQQVKRDSFYFLQKTLERRATGTIAGIDFEDSTPRSSNGLTPRKKVS